ncbi:MAG: hypothetical protein AB7V18_14525 [Pyrinomonadaceae bacterium]
MLIEIDLQIGDRLENLCTKDDPAELIEDGVDVSRLFEVVELPRPSGPCVWNRRFHS